jgi:hypothetical protein
MKEKGNLLALVAAVLARTLGDVDLLPLLGLVLQAQQETKVRANVSIFAKHDF